MAGPDRQNALDHVVVVVVVMFENRSFDNLLGRLYQPGEVPSFEGVIGKDLSNPIPAWAEHGADRGPIPYGIATNMNTPTSDPGEEYQHVNTQLFGHIEPPSNRGILAERMIAPYNAPGPGEQPTMSGFVTDFISAFTAEMGRQPTYDEYSQIMAGYTPEQVPVLSTLARGFGTFDHWFAAVPSQTFTNRSFFHAATTSGFVVNSPYANFPVHNTAETLFDRFDAAGLTWRVYCDPPSSVTFTGLIHAPRLRDRFATHFLTTDRFYEDAANGELPTYSFIEPNLWHGHNDLHPPINALMPGMAHDAPSSILGGEALLAKIYTAIRSSASAGGSNCYNTLDQPRPPEDWPDVTPQPVPETTGQLVPLDLPLTPLAQAYLVGFLALAKQLGEPVPDVKESAAVTGAQRLAMVAESASEMFPGLRHKAAAGWPQPPIAVPINPRESP